ncbi:MAG: hypothetical protein CME71_10285 [Halobacteriovorax sp.]|nr:hypothetical protein [Halobacteriovorax sp.]
MQKSRFSHSLLNVSTSFLKIIFVSLIGFIATPIIVKHIGDENFGLYRLLSDWITFIGLAEFGIGGGILVLLSKSVRDKSKSKSLLQTIFGVYLRILPLYLLAALIIYFLLSFIASENVSSSFNWAFWIMAATYLFIPFGVYRSYLEASQKTSTVNFASTAQMFILNLLAITLAYFNFNLIGQALALFSSVAFFYVSMIYLGTKDFGLSLWSPRRNEVVEWDIWGQGRHNFFVVSSMNVGLLADSAIVTMFYSAKEVVPFFVSQRLGNLFLQKIQGAGVSIWASLVDLWHEGRTEDFLENFLQANKLLTIFSIILLVPMIIVNQEFVSVWMGPSNALDFVFGLILAIFIWTNAMNVFWRHILAGTGHLEQQVRPYVISGICNIIMTLILTKYWGLTGPILASSLALLGLMIWKVKLFNSHYSLNAVSLLKKLIPAFGLAALFLSLSKFYTVEQSWLAVGTIFCLNLIGLAVLSFLFLFNQREKQMWLDRIKRLRK